MMKSLRLWTMLIAAPLFWSALPALAQQSVAPPPSPPGLEGAPTGRSPGAGAHYRSSPLRDAFEKMSPEGRKLMLEAFKRGRPEPSELEAMRQARQEVLKAMAADRFDVNALRRAMSRERDLAEKHQAKRHEETLAALQKLSLEDRKMLAEGWGHLIRRPFPGPEGQ